MLGAACLEGEDRAGTIGSAEPGADFGAAPAHLRAGSPRLRLGSASGDGQFPGGFDLMWADGTEAAGVVRDELDVEHVLVVPLPAGARAPGT